MIEKIIKWQKEQGGGARPPIIPTVPEIHEKQICKSIEYSIGRTQRKRWHEREIDIDIIFFNDLVMNDKILTIPHLRLEKRKFVLIPSIEIAPNYIHPISKLTLKQILADCNDSSTVRIYG